MHDIDRNTMEFEPEADVFAMEEYAPTRVYRASPFSEEEEMALASELLSVTDEAELDQFLGNLFKKAWRGVKKVGSAVGQAAKPLLGALKPLAKQALPVLGGALGSFVAPGAGTAIGSALGSAVGDALEMEFEGMNAEEMEFETARRIVRIAGNAAQHIARGGANPGANLNALVRAAITKAVRQHVPDLATDNEVTPSASSSAASPSARSGAQRSGRWFRRGNKIILLGV